MGSISLQVNAWTTAVGWERLLSILFQKDFAMSAEFITFVICGWRGRQRHSSTSSTTAHPECRSNAFFCIHSYMSPSESQLWLKVVARLISLMISYTFLIVRNTKSQRKLLVQFAYSCVWLQSCMSRRQRVKTLKPQRVPTLRKSHYNLMIRLQCNQVPCIQWESIEGENYSEVGSNPCQEKVFLQKFGRAIPHLWLSMSCNLWKFYS